MGWHGFTSPNSETCFCQWTDVNLHQQKLCLVGLGFSLAGLIGVGEWADSWHQMNAEIARHRYVCSPRLLHLLSASFIPAARARTGIKCVHEFSVVLCTDACSILFLEDSPVSGDAAHDVSTVFAWAVPACSTSSDYVLTTGAYALNSMSAVTRSYPGSSIQGSQYALPVSERTTVCSRCLKPLGRLGKSGQPCARPSMVFFSCASICFLASMALCMYYRHLLSHATCWVK